MRKKESILFVNPDYHCSFFYRDELHKLGWKADIFVGAGYPCNLLYSDRVILRAPRLVGERWRPVRWINHVLLIIWWISRFWRYQYHVYYGRPPALRFIENKVGLTKLFGRDYLIELSLAKISGVKLIYIPTGCNDYISKRENSLLDNGNVCGNCGAWDKCFDAENELNFARVNRYFDMAIGLGSIDSSQFAMVHMKYKSIDLDLWQPKMQVPSEHKLPPTQNLRIMHSAYLENSGRSWKGRNIKGSPYVLQAIERLREEGHSVEFYFVKDKPSNQMRFYQAQADIIVEQLIWGWWGSTFVEASALGKPVVCYLRPSWKDFFFKTFPEYNELPIIEANTETIYQALKKLVVDEEFRRRKALESRMFAEAHFDLARNTRDFINRLEAL